jgi:hypothetical protein
MNKFDNTEEWNLYQIGLDYDAKTNYHNKTDLHWNFYNSNQWVGIVTNGLSKWTFNICKAAINYFIAFICSQKIKITYSVENLPDEPETEVIDQLDNEGNPVQVEQFTPAGKQQLKKKEFVELLTNMAEMKWEKEKMDSKLRQLVLDGAVTGDYYAYTYWDPDKKTGQDETGDFCTEIVDGVNVMFGNPNNREVEPQPYILIPRRSMVEELKNKAKKNGIKQSLIDTITSDVDNNYQAGKFGKIELDNRGDTGKALSIIKLYKKNGEVFWKESTRHCPIVNETSLGISCYPLAAGNWDTVKNSHRGMGAIDGIIDNQISINQLFAMVSYWMKMSAFGKVVYDSTLIPNWSNKIGEALKSNGPIGEGVFKQLQAGNFNQAVIDVINLAIKYTKEFIGANDTLTGQVDPEKASGIAILNGGKQASIPLGNPSANRDQFVEDLGLIWGEFFLKKYKNRIVSIKKDGKVITTKFSTDGMDDILLNCKVDVGPSTIYSETTGIEELRNLLSADRITKLQYFERMEKMHIIPDVQGLIKDVRAEEEQVRMLQEQEMKLKKQNADAESQFEKFLSGLSPELQRAIAEESQAMIGQTVQ